MTLGNKLTINWIGVPVHAFSMCLIVNSSVLWDWR